MGLTGHSSSSERAHVKNFREQQTFLSPKPNEKMKDYLIEAETLSSSLELAGQQILEKLSISVVANSLPENYEQFETHFSSGTLTPVFGFEDELTKVIGTPNFLISL